ncbi:MAG: amidohydrolase family protein, partial [Pseudoflavonifractor sp.]
KLSKFLAVVLTLSLTLGVVPAFAAETKTPADSVYRNGKIYTVNAKMDVVSAIAVSGDKLVYVGDEAGVAAYIGKDTKVTDLGGKMVMPGLIESHMHVDKFGFGLQDLDIFGKPKDVTLRIIAEAVEGAQPGEWITASGWNETIWTENTYPTKEDLDAVAPNNPVMLGRSCGHMSWANSKAFEAAGVTKDTPNPQGGELLKNKDGSLQGCMTDTASGLVSKAQPRTESTPAQQAAQLKDAMMLAQSTLFSFGITTAMDAGVSVERIEQYKKLYESKDLKLRMYPMLRLGEINDKMADYLRANPVKVEEQYDNHLSVRCVKLFADGALGARGARFIDDYSDQAGHKGDFRHTDAEMDALVKLAYDQGYQVATHAIGDGAVKQTLDSYEKVLKANPRDDHRLRVEHFQVAQPSDMDRAIKLNVIPAMQFTHAISDLLMAESRVGPERIKNAYAWRTMLDKGAIIPGGTDAPFDRVNPFHCMYAGVTRTALNGLPKGGWYPEQCITRDEMLKSYTNWSAYSIFEEGTRGSLEVGKLADFIVLDRNIMTCPALEIKDTQVLTTVSGGEVVYTMDTKTPTIQWQGEPIEFFGPVTILAGTTYAPLKDLMTGISATQVTKDNSVSVTLDGKTVTLPIKTVANTPCIAVRALFEGLGATVSWYPASRCVSTAR